MNSYDTPQYLAIKNFWNEPDHYSGCAYGLPIFMQRNYSKAWCGYVGVPSHSQLFGMDYSDSIKRDDWREIKFGGQSPIVIFCAAGKDLSEGVQLDLLFDVPGGLTWARDRKPGQPKDNFWWFGFDCSHYNDLSPADVFNSFSDYPFDLLEGRTYRNFAFVKRACFSLASNLSDFSSQFPETFK